MLFQQFIGYIKYLIIIIIINGFVDSLKAFELLQYLILQIDYCKVLTTPLQWYDGSSR